MVGMTKTRSKKKGVVVTREMLRELFIEPLCSLIDSTRLEIIGKMQSIEDSLEIMAREMRRQIDE
jgi:hypothetical protein